MCRRQVPIWRGTLVGRLTFTGLGRNMALHRFTGPGGHATIGDYFILLPWNGRSRCGFSEVVPPWLTQKLTNFVACHAASGYHRGRGVTLISCFVFSSTRKERNLVYGNESLVAAITAYANRGTQRAITYAWNKNIQRAPATEENSNSDYHKIHIAGFLIYHQLFTCNTIHRNHLTMPSWISTTRNSSGI